MAKESEMRMNLVAIKRVDPYAKDIVDSSAHVAFYTFNFDTSEWEKTDVEGALFIYSRNAEPYNNIFINNRLNTNSLVEPITAQIELQSQPPFLLYRNERSKIRGFWFYNSNECDRIGDLIKRLVKDCQLKMVSNAPLPPPLTIVDKQNTSVSLALGGGGGSKEGVNILSMLSKAQEDFNKGVKPSPNTSAPSRPQGINNPSVMSFFAAIPAEVPKLQRLQSTPNAAPVQTVDEIEKQQRAATPCNNEGKNSPHQQFGGGANSLNNGFRMMRVTTPENHQQKQQFPSSVDLGTSPLDALFRNSNILSGAKTIPNATSVADIEQQQQQQKIQPLQELLKKSDTNRQNSNHTNKMANAGKPALMPPTMFTVKSGTKTSRELDSAAKKAPTDLLNKDQFFQALSYLIKNDNDFVNKLHEAYLKSIIQLKS